MKLVAGSRALEIYGRERVEEEFACNFGLNPAYRSIVESHGLIVSGTDAEGAARVVERRAREFFIATLFLPQISSTRSRPHPLIVEFLAAAARHRRHS